jgi:hypothetical protein
MQARGFSITLYLLAQVHHCLYKFLWWLITMRLNVVANEHWCSINSPVSANDPYLSRTQCVCVSPLLGSGSQCCMVGIGNYWAKVTELANVETTRLICRLACKTPKTLNETVGNITAYKWIGGIQPANIERGWASLQVFVRCEVLKIHRHIIWSNGDAQVCGN